jgi:uncharacterized protein YfaS (alpha-2-macroglobulin family)
MTKTIISFILVIFTLQLSAQQKMTNYTALWKKVDDLVQKSGLTKSALEEVNKIYALAKKENNAVQQVKALVYKGNLSAENTENADEKNISVLLAELKSSKEPATSLLNSIIAQEYWNYLQQNRWKLYNRTATAIKNTGALEEWTTEDLHTVITKHFLVSLENKKILTTTKLSAFEPIIIKGNVRELRPTLYDLLAHNALAYFTNTEREIRKAAGDFEIADEAAFAEAASFAKHQFKTNDSTSLFFNALQLYQELTTLRINDASKAALIDLDIKRLEFVYQHAINSNKEELYIAALKALQKKYSAEPEVAQAAYLESSVLFNRAQNYNPENGQTENRFGLVRVKAQLEDIIKKYPGSEGAANAAGLLQQIERKELSMQTEKVNVPDQPFRTMVSYKNVSRMYYRIIAVDENFFDQLRERYDDIYWNKLIGLPVLKKVTQDLPSVNDYRGHSVEVKVNALPVGRYALLASANENFSFEGNPMAVQYFFVSNIAFFNQGNHYFVVNRETGLPLQNANVQVWQQKYDYTKNRNTLTAKEKLVTTKDGYVQLTPTKQYEQVRLEINWQKDKLFLDGNQNRILPIRKNENYTKEKFEKENQQVFLFTDRSIYRPGQLLYFKGILITKDFESKKHRTLVNHSTTLYLRDVNGQTVDSLTVQSNSFGSVSGKFQLPASGLTGSFSIVEKETNAQVFFNIEEYKRPKFFVEYQKLKTEYKLNDTVTVKGSAMAYAGSSIGGAKLSYRVTREARFPYPWFGRGKIFPPSQPMEIAHGELTTNADGSFNISFKAIPDAAIAPSSTPIFNYVVAVDVTDINGETRSAETNVSIGYHSLELGIQLPEGSTLYRDSIKKVIITAKNLSGEPQSVKALVELFALETPSRLIRPRYWNAPDTFIYSKEEYSRYFPYDEYGNESDKESWKRKEKVVTIEDSVKNGILELSFSKQQLRAGWFVIEATAKDKNGQPVKTMQYVEVKENTQSPGTTPDYYEASLNKSIFEPGETAQLNVSTAADQLWIVQQTRYSLDRDNDAPPFSYQLVNLNKESKTWSYSLQEKDRGGFGINHVFVKHNRLFIEEEIVSVPWTNKKLDISFTTYRDKTLPDSKEEWAVKISGYKGEKIAAEMLTSMYDASLDQFAMHNWSLPSIYSEYSGYTYGRNDMMWNRNVGFTTVNAENRYYPDREIKRKEKIYDELIWSNTSNYVNIRVRGYASEKSMAQSMVRREIMDARQLSTTDNAPPAIAANEEISAVIMDTTQAAGKPNSSANPVRSDFRETAFFLPDLKTDAEGNIRFSFDMPEALTQWKWQLLAHTSDLSMGINSKTIVTQKELMVQPNPPRFLREGDQVMFAAKISNLTAAELSGEATLQLIDAANGQVVDGLFTNIFPIQYFTVAASQSTAVQFTMTIPYNFNRPLLYRIVAKAGTHSDGEEMALPVLTNRMLVTESLPIQVKGSGTKNFTFDKLLQSEKSPSLTHHAVTVEYSSNPAWYAVQSLPYLTDYPYECAEQLFNRFYANALAASVANSNPKIKQYFEKWLQDSANGKSGALLSNLEKNQELKSILLEETPWVMDAKNESQQKKNIALLFDLNRQAKELEASINKLKQSQTANGGFVWFSGGPEDRYITQYIVTGIGRLKKLNAVPAAQKAIVDAMANSAINYLDQQVRKDYDNLKKRVKSLSTYVTDDLNVQYLYAMSYYPEKKYAPKIAEAAKYYTGQAKKYWLKNSKYSQAMIALVLQRQKEIKVSSAIMASLKERSMISENLGRYWKDVQPSYYWYQAPVETQVLMIEAFDEVAKDNIAVGELKQWLLLQKQITNWRTTKATADACYALLMRGNNWLASTPSASISLGNTSPVVFDGGEAKESGTGYFKSVVQGADVRPDLGNIKVNISSGTKPDPQQISWGAVYWQYFENLDRITGAATPLSIKKTLWIEKNTAKGPTLTAVEDGTTLKVGDKLTVRVQLSSDRAMEYIHVKDMRASGTEPVDVISAYQWKGGLGFYQSTRDAATNFFISYLPKGTYIFEYNLFVSQEGNFSVGVSTAQCMYAPEFSAHSEGIRIKVKGN